MALQDLRGWGGMFVDSGAVGSCATAVSAVATREHKVAVLISLCRNLLSDGALIGLTSHSLIPVFTPFRMATDKSRVFGRIGMVF